ncbi:MAG: transglycosylase SLT domain-containing protein [Spirochaetaceae bacterium]|nr:transglycosylase SLT domain-containing protein [Spirochaetaceae bacterium]
MAVIIISAGGIGFFFLSQGEPPEPDSTVQDKSVEIPLSLEVKMPASSVLASGKRRDIILEFYREPSFKEGVVEFFTSVADSRVLASVILAQAEIYNIPPALAFALCWEESRYTVRAINKKNANGSVDRGLFQLNNLSFPHLRDADFFNPETNARYGMAHLRWCLDTAGSELAGLAMYNAGAARVTSNQTPKRTLDYVSRILEMRNRVEDAFRVEYFLKEGLPLSQEAITATASEKKSELVQIAFFPYR